VRRRRRACTLLGMNNDDSWFERGHAAIVTGASKGFGFSVARLLAQRGIALTITARRVDELAAAAAALRELGPVEALAGDVCDLAHVHRLVERTRARFGRLDLLVNNASTLGRSPLPPLEQLSPAVLREIFTTNVFAPLHLIQHALPLIIQSSGTIVNVSSDAAVNAYPGWGGYGASKAALEHLSRTLAAELDGFGVSIVIADPGNMNTELHRLAEPGADWTGLPDAAEVAPALLRVLAGPRASFIRAELQASSAVSA
jgi:NAD(P)-dependent dehydrogenase (short-subunit alcohol dehydrogenase family)